MRPLPQAAIDLAKEQEGFCPRRNLDPVGRPQIGYGHLLSASDPLWHATLTPSHAEGLLVLDLQRVASEPLWDNLGATIVNGLTDAQWAAIIDFTYNEGIGHFAGSTLRHMIFTGLNEAAGQQFKLWVYGTIDGREVVLPGLVKRRAAEAALWNG